MPKLLLTFNQNPIDTFIFDQQKITLGRDSNNDFVIDSLAVASNQISIECNNGKSQLRTLSENFPVLINHKNVQAPYLLCDRDTIQLGKHELVFVEDQAQSIPQEVKPRTTSLANLQILSGLEIGRLIPLKRVLTEITHNNQTSAIIAKRKDGYHISRLSDETKIKIDNKEISSETTLEDNVKITIDCQDYLFFFETS